MVRQCVKAYPFLEANHGNGHVYKDKHCMQCIYIYIFTSFAQNVLIIYKS